MPNNNIDSPLSDLHVATPESLRRTRLQPPVGSDAFKQLCTILRKTTPFAQDSFSYLAAADSLTYSKPVLSSSIGDSLGFSNDDSLTYSKFTTTRIDHPTSHPDSAKSHQDSATSHQDSGYLPYDSIILASFNSDRKPDRNLAVGHSIDHQPNLLARKYPPSRLMDRLSSDQTHDSKSNSSRTEFSEENKNQIYAPNRQIPMHLDNSFNLSQSSALSNSISRLSTITNDLLSISVNLDKGDLSVARDFQSIARNREITTPLNMSRDDSDPDSSPAKRNWLEFSASIVRRRSPKFHLKEIIEEPPLTPTELSPDSASGSTRPFRPPRTEPIHIRPNAAPTRSHSLVEIQSLPSTGHYPQSAQDIKQTNAKPKKPRHAVNLTSEWKFIERRARDLQLGLSAGILCPDNCDEDDNSTRLLAVIDGNEVPDFALNEATLRAFLADLMMQLETS